MILEILAGALFLVLAAVALARSVTGPPAAEAGGERLLIVLHDAVKVGFWFTLAAVFFGFAVLEEPQELRWLLVVPAALAALRFGLAYLLWRQ